MKEPCVIASLLLLAAACGAPGAEGVPASTAIPTALTAKPTAAATVSPSPSASARAKLAPLSKEISPPIAPNARLSPCRVELEHKYRDVAVSDDTWKTRRVAVRNLVRKMVSGTSLVDWEKAPIAPAPLTREQALAAGAEESGQSVLLMLEGYTLSYEFDAKGRTSKVNYDPSADSGDYNFRYQYECNPEPSPGERPSWSPAVPECKTSKDCGASEVCVHALDPEGKVGTFFCASEVLSGNGQGVACATDADCQDARLSKVGDIKDWSKGERLSCQKHGDTPAKICNKP